MRRTKPFALLLALSFIAMSAYAVPAQAGKPGPAAEAGREKRGHGPAAFSGISKQKMEQLKRVRQKYRPKAKALRAEMQKHRAALRDLLKADSADQAAYKKALTGLAATQRKQQALREARQKDVAKILTPKEMAKLLSGRRPPSGPARRGGKGPRN